MRYEQVEGFFGALEKIARSPVKDFLAGIDPTGTKTLQYGMQDAKKAHRPSAARQAIGTVGGVIGGGAVVPAAVGGIIGGLKGAVQGSGGLGKRLISAGRGFVSGAAKPYRSVYRGVRTGRALKAAQGGARLSKAQAGHVVDFIKHEIPGGAALAGNVPVVTPKHIQNLVGNLSPAQVTEARKRLGGKIAGGVGMLGLSGAIGGGSAHLQYGKGANIQQKFDRRAGHARSLGAKYGQ